MSRLPIASIVLVIASCLPSSAEEKKAPPPTEPEVFMRQAAVQEKSGNLDSAIDLYRRAISAVDQQKDKHFQASLDAHNSIGQIDERKHDLQSADEEYRSALSVASRLFGTGTPELIKPLTRIAEVCYEEGKYPEACSYYKQALALSERKTGPDNAVTSSIREKLIDAYSRNGDAKNCEPLIKQALEIREKSGDHNSPQLLAILNCYSELLERAGRDADAAQIDEKIRLIHASKSSVSADLQKSKE